MVSAPHRSGPATSRRLDDWRLLGGSPTEPKEHQPQRNQYRHRRGVTDHGHAVSPFKSATANVPTMLTIRL